MGVAQDIIQSLQKIHVYEKVVLSVMKYMQKCHRNCTTIENILKHFLWNNLVTCIGDRKICAISWRLLENPGELA